MLYNKYRPVLFADVIGQGPIKATIQHEIVSGHVSHAFLFCGPRGVGKTSMARLIARSINCHNRKDGESEPCNECSSCAEMLGGTSLSIIEIDAASQTGVDNIRENIIANARTVAGGEKNKVFIIDEVHMLSTAAFNALLKVLEEPPKNVVFIMATTEAHKIPVTVASRCQRFDFKKPGFAEVVDKLKRIAENEGMELDDAIFSTIVRYTGGYVRDAESLLGQIIGLGGSGKKITLEDVAMVLPRSHNHEVLVLLEAVAAQDTAEAIKQVIQLSEDGVDLLYFVDEMTEFVRSLLYLGSGTLKLEDLLYDEETKKRLKSLLTGMKQGSVVQILDDLLDVKYRMKMSDIPQIPLEIALVRWGA